MNFDSYTWSTTETTEVITVYDTGTYSLTVVDSNSCTARDSIDVLVYELPEIYAGEDDSVTLGQDIQLLVTGGDTYLWSPTDVLDDSTAVDPIATLDESTTFTVLGTDVNGCQNTDTVTITVNVNFLYIPYNTITPNGDGLNDTWVIENLHAYQMHV